MKELNQRRSLLKSKLRQRKNVFAAWNSFAHPSITEIFCKMGVDFTGIDLEHSTISQEQSQRIIAAAQAGGCLCLPRVATHNEEMIKRLLDSGADGIIVPMVSRAGEAEKIVSWMKYPPAGQRGFGVARAQGYGFDFNQYISNWNDVLSFIVQIESIEAVENIDGILACEDIDGAMIGPYDISGSLGVSGQLEHPKVKAAAVKVIDACRRYSKACGTHLVNPNLENVKEKLDEGYTFIVLSSDLFLLWKWGEQMREIINKER